LQELIAPRQVEFYNSNWEQIGTKRSLCDSLFHLTGIDQKVLRGADPRYYPVAERMSWVAQRQTTRLEDMAYCLLGLFDVNMPLLYGEGKRSFRRLQEEIMKVTDDYTIFAWVVNERLEMVPSFATTGLLAESPQNFEGSWKFSASPRSLTDADVRIKLLYKDRPLLSSHLEVPVVTARGIRMKMPIIRQTANHICAALYFSCEDDREVTLVTLDLQRTAHANGGYGRVVHDALGFLPLRPGESLVVDIMTLDCEIEHSEVRSWQPQWLNPYLMTGTGSSADNEIVLIDNSTNDILKTVRFEWGSFQQWRSSDAIAIFDVDFEIDSVFIVFGIDFTGNGRKPWCRIHRNRSDSDARLTWTSDQFRSTHRTPGRGSDRELTDYCYRYIGQSAFVSAAVKARPYSRTESGRSTPGSLAYFQDPNYVDSSADVESSPFFTSNLPEAGRSVDSLADGGNIPSSCSRVPRVSMRSGMQSHAIRVSAHGSSSIDVKSFSVTKSILNGALRPGLFTVNSSLADWVASHIDPILTQANE
jgi:hypothetical protein